MKAIKMRVKLTVIIGMFILMVFSMNIFPYIYHNGSGNGYKTDDESGVSDTDKASKCTKTIETYVMQGGGYFLKGNSYIQSLLHQVELQDLYGIDYNELERLTDRALLYIFFARWMYDQLVYLAEATPYNQGFIFNLTVFDYDSLQAELGLNKVVFDQVRKYLETGDITGTFEHTRTKLKEIEDLLSSIKQEIATGVMPGLPALWKLNETCSESLLFGSYAARVYHALR